MIKQIGGVLLALSMVGLGCEEDQGIGGAAVNDGGSLVQRTEKAGEEIIASDKKAEAREWLKAPTHVLFKFRGGKDKLTGFVEEFYSAGAEKVYIGNIETEEGKDFAGTLLVVLPKDAAARAKLFAIDKRVGPFFEEDPVKDEGQKYFYYSFD